MVIERRNLSTSAEKGIEVTSTFIEVLIGLSSAIIAVILAFFPDITSIQDINIGFLKIFLVVFGISVACGLFAFMVLIGAIKQNSSKNRRKGGKSFRSTSSYYFRHCIRWIALFDH
jgi:hypothetical protein